MSDPNHFGKRKLASTCKNKLRNFRDCGSRPARVCAIKHLRISALRWRLRRQLQTYYVTRNPEDLVRNRFFSNDESLSRNKLDLHRRLMTFGARRDAGKRVACASVDERKDKHSAMMTSVEQIKEREREKKEGRKEG